MDFIMIIKAVAALIFVLGLLLLSVWGLKLIENKSSGNRFFKKLKKNQRLDIVEIRRIDARNSIVLVRCDQTEHLLLVGPSSQVIETNITQPNKFEVTSEGQKK